MSTIWICACPRAFVGCWKKKHLFIRSQMCKNITHNLKEETKNSIVMKKTLNRKKSKKKKELCEKVLQSKENFHLASIMGRN